jgi:hypothetical protein
LKTQFGGLRIEVNTSNGGPVFPECSTAPDVTVILGDLGAHARDVRLAASTFDSWYTTKVLDESGRPVLKVWQLPGGRYYWRYTDQTEIVVDEPAKEVRATWVPPYTETDTLGYIFGPVLGFALRQRGVVSLHGSAVEIDSRAVVLVGEPTAGKSTTAAAFAKRGRPVLTDDIAALTDLGDAFLVQPGIPQIYLWRPSVQALWGSPDALPELSPAWGKCYLDLTRPPFRFADRPLPLGAVYVLAGRQTDQGAAHIRALGGADGLVQLVTNTYANRMLDPALRAREFDVLGRVVGHIPVRHVHAPDDLTHLDRLCDAILADYRSVAAAR